MRPGPLDPICAPATPLLPAAVGVVRVSGHQLSKLLEPLLQLPTPRSAGLRELHWGGFRERALVLYFPEPQSYTGEDVVEFQLHGNPLLIQHFLIELGRLGIRMAEPGEFTRRALLNGKQSILEAEALRDIISAATDTQLRMAQARSSGLPPWLTGAREALVPWVARAEATMDYGEEEGLRWDWHPFREVLSTLQRLFHVEQARSGAARWLRDGIGIALVGRPNSGKSTLFNAMAGEDRAIVTELPGTTRDVLECRTEWRGLPLRLFDTAGLRATEDLVEKLGIAKIAPILRRVDLILHLIPAGDPPLELELRSNLDPFQTKTMEVRTFGDQHQVPGILISASTGALDELEKALKHRFLGDLGPDACLGAMATERQREILDELELQTRLILDLPEGTPLEVVASSLQGMWSLFVRLTGEDRSESTLDEVFRGFCLGK